MAGCEQKDPVPKEYLECLKTTFDRSEFSTAQWDIISSIFSDCHSGDNILITQGGYDAAICWQFPSVYLDTITVVVSSLKCEMRDQVLSAQNIKTCFNGEDQMNKKETFAAITRGKYNIVHVTPEFITSDRGYEFLDAIKDRLTLIAITDAHNIYTSSIDGWRSEYRQLGSIREALPTVPILAISPTVTQACQDVITRSLKLIKPQVTRMNIDRPNLEYIVEKGSCCSDKWIHIGRYIENIHKIGPTIIFCITQKETERVVEEIKSHGYGHLCAFYHHGCSLADREKVEDDFNNNRIGVVVATNAFSLSSVKKDVRMVIHYQRPKNMEDYYQQVGFAGRDGHPARCLMFFREEDQNEWDNVLSYKVPTITQQEKDATLKPVRDFATTTQCRRRFIVNYFSMRETCCDNCRSALQETETELV